MYSYYPQSVATTVVSTEGRVWNGSSWGTVPSSTTSTYNSYASSGGTASSSTSTTAPSLVQQYTDYYNSYHAFAQQAQAEADKYATSPAHATQREEWLRHVTWYNYYADQASRAAHYYYQNPNTATPPPFELPPPPAKANEPQNNNISSSAPVVGQLSHSISSYQQPTPTAPVAPQATTPASSTTTASANSPDGLKRFFHKCLQACTTEEQRKEVQGKLQLMMTNALQAGTLHSTNWDARELIRPTLNAGPGPSLLQGSAPAAGNENKRAWNGLSSPQAPTSSSAATYVPKNKRTRFQVVEEPNTLGNHNYAVGRTSSLTPSTLTETTTTTRVTPPLEAATTSTLSYYGPSSSSPPLLHGYDKQLPSNDSYYGPKHSSSSHHQVNNITYYGESVSGGSEEDFMVVPHLSYSGRKKPATNQKGFEQSHSKLAKRANRFGNATTTSASASTAAVMAESSNFDKYMGKGMIGGSNKKLEEADFESMTVKGTCTRLEKEYLRLTAPPRAELVRPQYILEQHYHNLVSEWNSKSRRRDYLWFCSQFKALRQDCRVQRIQNAFCVRVYETHARIALESDDVNEFNQCQTQLMELYDLLLSSSSASGGEKHNTKEQKDVLEHRNEFLAYRFIYYVFLTGSHKGSSSSSDLMTLMLSLTPEQWRDPAIAHAARFREAVALEDFHAFFRLRRNCPNLGAYLVDRMVPLIRFKALQRICKAYRPSVELPFVLTELGFDQEEETDGKEWLESCGCILKDDMVLTKDTVVRESNLQVKQSLI